jgi:hypothetical protein
LCACGDVGEGGAHRVARDGGGDPGGDARCVGKRQRQHGGPAGKRAVGPAEHGVLLVQDHGRLGLPAHGRQHRRDARVAAERDDRGRIQLVEQQPRLRRARGQPDHGSGGAPHASPSNPGTRQHMDLAADQALWQLRHRTPVRHQHDAMPAREQLQGKRLGREEVPARATGCDYDRTHRGASHS